jgi:uncharacterized protein (DUF58 family)
MRVLIIIFYFLFTLICLFLLSRYAGIKRLAYKRYFTPQNVFEGEGVMFVEEIYNRFFLPLFFVDIEAFMYNELELSEYTDDEYHMQHFISRFFLAPFTKIKRSVPVRCIKRGYFELDSVNILFFGFNLYMTSKAGVHVFPRALALDESNPLEFEMQNTVYADKKLLPDPFSFSGVRDYRPGDPFGSVNYKATAKTGMLKVNNRDYFSSRNFMVYINFHMPSLDDPLPLDLYETTMERALSYASDMVMKSIQCGYSAGFAANCKLINGAGYVRYPMGRGQSHYVDMLKAMSSVRMVAGHSFNWLMRHEIDSTWNAEVYIMTIGKTHDVLLEKTVSTLRGMGNHVAVIAL